MLTRAAVLAATVFAFGQIGSVAVEAGSPAESEISEDDGLWLDRVKLKIGEGKYEAARDILEELNRTPLSGTLARTEQQKLLGQVYLYLEEYGKAIAALTNVIDFPRTDHVTALINRCYAYMKVNLIVDARSDCVAARVDLDRAEFSRFKASGETIAFRKVSLAHVEAQLALRSGQLERALDFIGEAHALLEDAPQLSEWFVWDLDLLESKALAALGDSEAALASVAKTLQAAPERERHAALATRAAILLRQGERDAAVKEYVSAAESATPGKTRAKYYFEACSTLLQTVQREQAVAERSALLENALDPCRLAATNDDENGLYHEAHAAALFEMSRALFETTRFDEGMIRYGEGNDELRKAAALRPRSNVIVQTAEDFKRAVGDVDILEKWLGDPLAAGAE